MLWRKETFTRTSRWFSFMLILVVFALIVSGCRSGKGGGIDDGGNGNGDYNAFNVFIGVWKNTNVPEVGTVQISINEPVEDGYIDAELAENQFFKGRVTCSNFSQKYLDIDGVHLGDDPFYIWATIFKDDQKKYLAVRGGETVDEEADPAITNYFRLEGELLDDDTLKVTILYITHENGVVYDLAEDSSTEYFVFEKQ